VTKPSTPTIERETDLNDWRDFRRFRRLANHWYWRPGWRPDRHYMTWYVLFGADTRLGEFVAEHQKHLDLTYLDLVPPDLLHMTVQGVAFADDIAPDQVAEIGAVARHLCADLLPLDLTIGPIAGYPGGVFLRASPWQPVRDLRERLRAAIAKTIGARRVPDEPRRFKPHVSIGYCNKDVPAAELIERVEQLRQLPPIKIGVEAVHLIELRRDGQAYRWDVAEPVPLSRG
jgi:2'-5' RNA ligase